MVIVSGGQTGVDRAALDAARQVGLECAGWCPHGRWAEDGPLSPCYPLVETPETNPAQRTAWNVRDSDATLILLADELSGGTRLTLECAVHWRKPCALVMLQLPEAADIILDWLEQWQPARLNIAGPRESECPGIYARSHRLLTHVLTSVKVLRT